MVAVGSWRLAADADTPPPPISLLRGFDPRARKRTLPLVVLGKSAQAFVGEVTAGRPRAAALRELGRVGDVTIAVALYAFEAEADPRTVREHLARASAWVIAAADPKDDRIWTTHLEDLNRWVDAQRPDVVIGLYGDPPPTSTWRAYGGRTPVVADATAAKVLAELVRVQLRTAVG